MKKLLYLFLTACLTITMLIFAVNSGLCDPADEQIMSSPRTQHTDTVLQYWTKERLRNAQPMEIKKSDYLPRESFETKTEPAGEPFIIPSGTPDTDRIPAQTQEEPIVSLVQSEPDPFRGNYPFSYTSYKLFPDVHVLYMQYPYQTIGKVFFTIPGQDDYVCSGAVVNTGNQSSVWTAGHCVYSPDIQQWHENFIFVPARYQGRNTYQIWTAQTLAAPAGWTQKELLEYDLGGAYMDRGGPGNRYLVGQLGSLGFAANLNREQHWHAAGYPAQSPFDGEHMHFCASTWAENDQPSGNRDHPKTVGIGCDMTGGSSGGPWIRNLSGQDGNLINGNVSYGYDGVPDKYYSPYFGDGAIELYNWLDANPTP